MAPTLAVAALALAAMWPPRGLLAADRAHVPVPARKGRYLMDHQRLGCRTRSKQNKRSSSSRSPEVATGAAGAALPGREMATTAEVGAGEGLRYEFLEVLLSRRRDLQG